MAYTGFNWSVLNLPFRAGLMQNADDRARPTPFLDIAKDVEFAELGGVQARRPMSAALFGNGAIFGGGTLANCRRIGVVNDELCVFTDTGLYSWNAQLIKWVLRGTHLAVNVSEQSAFATPGDQFEADCAELNGTIVYAWTESVAAFNFVFVAAIDKVTGSMLMAPATFGLASSRPRLVALATKILLFALSTNGLEVRAIDPANPSPGATGAGTLILATANSGSYYDVAKAGTQDLAVGVSRRAVTTSYTVFWVPSSLFGLVTTKARTCDGPIAVATIADGTQMQVIRANGTNIQGDLLTTTTQADVFTGQAIGTAASTTINQVTVAYGAATTARAYWTSGNIGENSSFTDFTVKSNTVTTANVVGAQADFRHRLGIASRAFTYAGHSYLWLVFAQDSGASAIANVSTVRAQLQNTYFLYRDDNFVVSQATKNVAGGFEQQIGRLPGVALTGDSTTFSWCATTRRRIELGTGENHSAFAARSPRAITFTFDSDRARRCARIGRTMYITGGIPLQYDGVQTAEVGFLSYPWYFEPAVGGVGAIPAGAYTWKATYGWTNAQGEFDRSTTATGSTLTIAAGKFVFLNDMYLNTTLKVGARRPSIDMWRTTLVTAGEQPFYKVTSQDPTALPGANNGFVLNDDTLDSPGVPLPDNFTDAILTTKEQSAENGLVFEYTAPPGASLIVETDTRIYLGGITGDPDRVWPSRLRAEGEVASFHEDLAVQIPRPGGAMTALAIHSETLTVFRESAIYRLPGEGFSNTRQGSNFVAFDVPGGVGAVSQESVGSTPLGTVFKSSKGWYLLTLGWGVQYIGAAVTDYDSETVHAVTTVENQHQVRILSGSRMIVWDYSAATEESPIGQWFEWTVGAAIHAAIWKGQYVALTPTGPVAQSATFTGTDFGLDVETTWVKPSDPQGDATVKDFSILGEYRGPAFLLRVRVARDYLTDGAGAPVYFDDSAWPVSPTTIGSALRVSHTLTLLRCSAFKVRLTAVSEAVRASLVTTALAPQVATSAAVWTSTWSAVGTRPGEMGNALSMSVAFIPFVAALASSFPYTLPFYFISDTAYVLVNDHFTWSVATGQWEPDTDNIGVIVAGSLTVADLEAAIADGTTLATLASADATPSKVVDVAGLLASGFVSSASFSAGAYGAPAGESLKLTGLAAKVGLRPGIRQLPAAQRAP